MPAPRPRLFAAALAVVTAFSLTAPLATTAEAAPKKYKNCAALNKDYPSGVGMRGAVDKTSGKTKSKPVTNFTRNDAVYKRNTHLDRDKDKIACEKYTGTATATPAPKKAPAKPAARSTTSVSLTTASLTPRVGTKVAVEGVVKGLPAGTVIEVQTTQGRTWSTAATATVRASGRYTAHVTFTKTGRTNVRVIATSGKASATSPTLTVTPRA